MFFAFDSKTMWPIWHILFLLSFSPSSSSTTTTTCFFYCFCIGSSESPTQWFDANGLVVPSKKQLAVLVSQAFDSVLLHFIVFFLREQPNRASLVLFISVVVFQLGRWTRSRWLPIHDTESKSLRFNVQRSTWLQWSVTGRVSARGLACWAPRGGSVRVRG